MAEDNVITLDAKRKVIQSPPIATFTIGPVEFALAAMMSASRRQIETIIAAGIERLDELDGDADVEANGDELDGSYGVEDEFGLQAISYGAGCPVADAGELEDEGGNGDWMNDQRNIMGGNAMPVYRHD